MHKHTTYTPFASRQDLYSDRGWWFILVGSSTDHIPDVEWILLAFISHQGWLRMAFFIPLTFMLWCSFPFPFRDVFPLKRLKTKGKQKEKKFILQPHRHDGTDCVYREGHSDQKSHSSKKGRNKKELITLVNKLLLLTSTILITFTSVVVSALTF